MNRGSDDGGRMLKVGLLVDSLEQPRWVRRVVESIQQSNFASVSLIVHNSTSDVAGRSVKDRRRRGEHLLYSAYTRLDDLLFRRECRPDAFARVSIAELVSDCPVLHVTPRRTRYSDFIEGHDLDRIAAAQLDVAIRFGFRILRGKILELPRYGVWSFHHGDNLRYRGAPAGFWEVMRGDDVTGSILQILGPELDNGTVIYRSFSATDKRSVRRNKNNYYWKSAEFVIRKLRDVAEEGPRALCGAEPESYAPYSTRLFTVPRNAEMIRLLRGFIGRALRDKVDSTLHRHQWGLAYKVQQRDAATSPSLFEFSHLTPPRDRFWADPFPVKHGDDYYVFIEELLYGSTADNRRKAHISVIRIDAKGSAGPPVKVLETNCHLSYPFVLERDGTYYMLPEMAGNRRVDLYRCESFPGRWTKIATLLDEVNAVDPTLLFHNDIWWLFVGIAAEGANNVDELHLFYARDLAGPWQPHRRNPIKSDVRSSRPAGRPFCWGGSVYRPAQDCSRRYGYSIVLNKVLRLDPDAYQEVEVAKITPEWRPDIVATHTLNSCDGLTVVDVSFRIPRWRQQ